MRKSRRDEDTTFERILSVLEGHAPGMHRLGEPAFLLDTGLPEPVAELYRHFDGAELFQETLILVPSARVERVPAGKGERRSEGAGARTGNGADRPVFYRIGELGGDDLFVDGRGQVFRREQGTDEWLPEGSALDRWLLGVIEAQELLYDAQGEFREDVFDEDGELTAEVSERMQRRLLKRDRKAPAARWRLAQALLQQDELEKARDELEQVVADAPGFAWAWFDLAQISEELGELDAALDELVAAAGARPGYEHAGFFLAHAARVAARKGDEGRRAELAARALAMDPGLVRTQREGAQATLAEGDTEAALRLAEVAAALAPRDLAVLELLRRIRTQAVATTDESDPEQGA